MRYGSVCSGIEAATVAWEPLGWQAAWFAEIEPFPSAVLAHHYPNVPNYGDMTKLARRVLAGEIEAPDVLVGGTPCQAYSVAGMRAGLNDERGQLTLRFMELADAIDHVRARAGKPPCIIVWENVPGVLSDKTNAFGCFLAGLAGEDVELVAPGGKWSNAGCVYGPQRAIAWRTLDAQYFGVAQRRRRVFLVASARNWFDPATVLFEWDGVRRDTPPSREAGQETAGTLASRTEGGGFPETDEACSGYVQPVAGVKWPAEVACTLNAAFGKKLGLEDQHINGGAPLFVMQPVPLLEVGKRTGASTTDIRAGIGIGEPGDTMYTLQAGAQHGVAVAAVSDTLTSSWHNSNGATAGNNAGMINPVIQGMAVRRLTPRECERLQAFEDDYTKVPYRGKPADQCPDGPRYKALGNSMCVYNMRWIGRRIQSVYDLTRSVKQAA